MKFTHDGYKGLLEKLKGHGYEFANYTNWKKFGRCVILRHDIDNEIEKATELAAFEARGGENPPTLFCLLLIFTMYFPKPAEKGWRKSVPWDMKSDFILMKCSMGMEREIWIPFVKKFCGRQSFWGRLPGVPFRPFPCTGPAKGPWIPTFSFREWSIAMETFIGKNLSTFLIPDADGENLWRK